MVGMEKTILFRCIRSSCWGKLPRRLFKRLAAVLMSFSRWDNRTCSSLILAWSRISLLSSRVWVIILWNFVPSMATVMSLPSWEGANLNFFMLIACSLLVLNEFFMLFECNFACAVSLNEFFSSCWLQLRELRDFLNGLDNLHEYLKFSYPRLFRLMIRWWSDWWSDFTFTECCKLSPRYR